MYQFYLEGLYRDSDSKPAFFLSSKSQTEIDSTMINYHVLQAFNTFNKSIKPEYAFNLPLPNLRNYFLKRTKLARTVDQAYFALKALKQTSVAAPFLELANASEIDIGQVEKTSANY